MKKTISILLVITLVAGLFTGCEKKETPPALPPAGTMAIDFSTFANPAKSALPAGTKGVTIADKTNWTLATLSMV